MKRLYISKLVLLIALLSGWNWSAEAQTSTYSTSGAYVYTAPACLAVSIDMAGAQGGAGICDATGGLGGRVQCVLAVTTGQLLYVFVGGQGASYNYGYAAGGYNGGGTGYYYSGGGGGETDIRLAAGAVGTYTLTNRAIVAGGGGGNGYYDCVPYDNGGSGGYPAGTAGNSYDSPPTPTYAGSGGSQTGGGAVATGCGGGTSGSLGTGGNSATCDYGGGGGGGYYGGGGAYLGGGGGGSSYIGGTGVSLATTTTGYQTGAGYCTITPLSPAVTASPSSASCGSVLVGSTSIPTVVTLSGLYMFAGPLSISLSGTGFQISTDGINWGTTATLAYTPPSFSGVEFYVRFSPTSASSYSGSVSITGGGLTTAVNVPVSGTGVNGCSGTPTAGLATLNGSTSGATGGGYTVFTLGLSGSSASGGLTYQWLSSPNGSTFTNVTGAVLANYTFTGISANTYYECLVTCASTGLSRYSSIVEATFQGIAPTLCSTPTDLSGVSGNYTIATAAFPFVVPNSTSSVMSDAVPYSTASPRYLDQSATYICYESSPVTQNTTIGGFDGGGAALPVQMWVDFNGNGTFETSESIGGGTIANFSLTRTTIPITIPSGIPPGAYRFRVVVDYSSSTGNYAYPNIPSCTSASNANYAETRDYTMVIVPPNCTTTPNMGITAGVPTSACVAPFTPTIFNVGESNLAGVTYNWQDSSASSGGIWINYGGATGTNLTPTLSSTGTVWYRNSGTCAYGGSIGYSTSTAVSLNAPPSPISGTSPAPNFCTGVAQTLTSLPVGGTWSSTNTTLATTAGSTSGLITGGTLTGIDTIIYTLPTGCYASYVITVNAQPAAITGPTAFCQGVTVTYADVTPGGSWSSGLPGVASITPTTGVATGVSAGATNLTYQSPAGCTTTLTVGVNGLPQQYIVGPTSGSYCVGSSSTTAVTLGGSQNSTFNYQLLLAGVVVDTLNGNGGTLNFGIQSAPGVYSVTALNTATGCTRAMVGNSTIAVNPLPLNFTLSETGGGSFCAGSVGTEPSIVTVDGSQTGVTYYLFNDGAPYPSPGSQISRPGLTGSNLNFGPVSAAGTYTVKAINNATGCSIFLTGSVVISINPLPTPYPVTTPFGNSYCAGGPGQDIQLFSNTGISYALTNGSGTTVLTLSGTGGTLNFGDQPGGSYTIIATNTSTGCTNNMTGVATITENTPPNAYPFTTATGGSTGSFCAGGTGVDVILNGSDPGVNYQLYDGVTPVGMSVPGTGLMLDLLPQTIPGTYTVVATDGTSGCTTNMTGSVAVTITPSPTVETVTGGGNFCVGGTGEPVGVNPTDAGTSYQLNYLGSSLSTVTGTGGAITFGTFTATGIYTVTARNGAGCVSTMAGAASIATNPLPAQFNVTVTGSGIYCAGGTGQAVGLDASATGITYQLYRSSSATGVPVTGTGSAISFGYQTIAGNYTVVATNVSTLCVNTMAGSGVISVNPLPVAYTTTGGGNFCIGAPGVPVGLNGSATGIDYQLFLGLTPIGAPVTGSGSVLDFGLQTTGGTYTVLATNTVTGCTKYMTGGIPVNVNPLPDVFTVTGGGLYCAGDIGVHVGLSGSVTGIKYQLYNSLVATGTPVAGTGYAIDFGLQTAGGNYTVGAVNSVTGCTNAMSGSVTVGTNALPVVYTVTGGGGYCAGGTGSMVMLSGSDVSVNYQLYQGGSTAGTAMAGTGSALAFGPFTTTGTYTVVATNSVTGCTMNMESSASISINPLPAVFPVSGGGSYCAGGTGFHVTLTGSAVGVNYTLSTGTMMPGTGSGLDFGILTAAGTYSVTATDGTTGCMSNMSGSAVINVNPLPATHNVTGGGSYCAGGAGVNIGLDTSNFGISYELYHGSAAAGSLVPGTGININFGMHTAAGTYTIVAVNTATGCTSNMNGSATVAIQSLPVVYAVTGGGDYCASATGSHVGLSASDLNINYQLWLGTTPVGIPVPGTGSTLDFGPQTMAGSYTVSATTATTAACTSNMSGSAVINVLPVIYPHSTITSSAGALACVGQTVNFTATPVGGGTAPTFQWLVNGASVGVGTTFSYVPSNGDLVIVTITSNYQCAVPVHGSDTMIMNVSPPEMPSAVAAVNPGPQICTGGTASFTATPLYGGTSPVYRWVVNSAFVASGTTYSYMPANGDIVTFMLGSNFPCRLSDTVFSNNITMQVEPGVLPVVNIATNPGTSVIAGQSVTFTANVSHGGSAPTYQWVVNTTEVPGATMSTYTTSTLSNNDSVSCMVGGTCGLVGFNSVTVKVQGSTNVGVTQVSGNNGNVVLVPNPNKGDFILKGTLASTDDQEVTLEVTDMLGQVVYTSKVTAQGGNVNEHITLNKLANGMYLLNLRSGSENTVFHFVIEQ